MEKVQPGVNPKDLEFLGLPGAGRPSFLAVLLYSDLETALSIELGGTAGRLPAPEAGGLLTLTVGQSLFSSEIVNSILCVSYFICKIALGRLLPWLLVIPHSYLGRLYC